MKATHKSPAIDNLLTALTGSSRTQSVANGTCILCGKSATSFRDELSRREYQISGMCQECQDKVF